MAAFSYGEQILPTQPVAWRWPQYIREDVGHFFPLWHSGVFAGGSLDATSQPANAALYPHADGFIRVDNVPYFVVGTNGRPLFHGETVLLEPDGERAGVFRVTFQ